jgi:DNA-binding MarR family transcriptional regulator
MVSESDIAKKLLSVIPKVMWRLRRDLRKIAEDELTVAQYRVLANINLGATILTELASNQGTSLPAMSKLVEGLVKRGFLIRTRRERDRRHVELTMTPKGRKTFTKFHVALRHGLADAFGTLTTEDKTRMELGLCILEKLFCEVPA